MVMGTASPNSIKGHTMHRTAARYSFVFLALVVGALTFSATASAASSSGAYVEKNFSESSWFGTSGRIAGTSKASTSGGRVTVTAAGREPTKTTLGSGSFASVRSEITLYNLHTGQQWGIGCGGLTCSYSRPTVPGNAYIAIARFCGDFNNDGYGERCTGYSYSGWVS